MTEKNVAQEKKPFCPVIVKVFLQNQYVVLTASAPYNGSGIYDDTEFDDPFGG